MRAASRADMVHRLYVPQQRFVVFGHDPTALAMAMLAGQVGMETFLIRPKGPMAPPPVPNIHYIRERPADALTRIGADPWTAVAVAMHQEEDDQEALVAALSSEAGYVGLLGSSRRLPRKLAFRSQVQRLPTHLMKTFHRPACGSFRRALRIRSQWLPHGLQLCHSRTPRRRLLYRRSRSSNLKSQWLRRRARRI